MDPEILERCAAWAEERYARQGEVQRWIREELERRELPAIQVSPLEGRTLALLAALADARRLLEVGTLGGTSALWLLSLLPEEARLVTLEREAEHAALAREAFRRAGEGARIELREGDARRTLERIDPEPPFDLVFVDADKESYPLYLDDAARLLRPGGLLLGDNAFWKGRVLPGGAPGPGGGKSGSGEEELDAATRGIRRFDRRLAEEPGWEAVILPIRDGLAVARCSG